MTASCGELRSSPRFPGSLRPSPSERRAVRRSRAPQLAHSPSRPAFGYPVLEERLPRGSGSTEPNASRRAARRPPCRVPADRAVSVEPSLGAPSSGLRLRRAKTKRRRGRSRVGRNCRARAAARSHRRDHHAGHLRRRGGRFRPRARALTLTPGRSRGGLDQRERVEEVPRLALSSASPAASPPGWGTGDGTSRGVLGGAICVGFATVRSATGTPAGF